MYTLKIFNLSDSAIYVYRTCGDSMQKEQELKLFLDNKADMTDEKGNKKESVYSPDYRVNAYSYGLLSGFGSYPDKKLPCNIQQMSLFFITESVMRSYTWDTIVLKQLFQKKMRVTKAQLDSLGWQIKYVP